MVGGFTRNKPSITRGRGKGGLPSKPSFKPRPTGGLPKPSAPVTQTKAKLPTPEPTPQPKKQEEQTKPQEQVETKPATSTLSENEKKNLDWYKDGSWDDNVDLDEGIADLEPETAPVQEPVAVIKPKEPTVSQPQTVPEPRINTLEFCRYSREELATRVDFENLLPYEQWFAPRRTMLADGKIALYKPGSEPMLEDEARRIGSFHVGRGHMRSQYGSRDQPRKEKEAASSSMFASSERQTSDRERANISTFRSQMQQLSEPVEPAQPSRMSMFSRSNMGKNVATAETKTEPKQETKNDKPVVIQREEKSEVPKEKTEKKKPVKKEKVEESNVDKIEEPTPAPVAASVASSTASLPRVDSSVSLEDVSTPVPTDGEELIPEGAEKFFGLNLRLNDFKSLDSLATMVTLLQPGDKRTEISELVNSLSEEQYAEILESKARVLAKNRKARGKNVKRGRRTPSTHK